MIIIPFPCHNMLQVKAPRNLGILSAEFAGAILLIGTLSRLFAHSEACDRACLNGFVDSYLQSVVAHDPSRALIQTNARFTENARPQPIGDGLWKSASEAPAAFRIYVPDPVSQQVGFFGVMKRSDTRIVLALRLKIENHKIAEIEQMVQPELDDYALPNLQKPRASFVSEVPSRERMPRERMLEVAKLYYESIVQSNGNVGPYASDCVRHENGMQSTSNPAPPPNLAEWSKILALGCGAQMSTHALSYIRSINNRRVNIADPETGLVFGLCIFR